MKKIYLIPDRKRLVESQNLREKYNTGFEYNDFYYPDVLCDKKKQQEIIDDYARIYSDFSEDTIHGAFFDVTPHSADPQIREISELRMRQSMEIAAEMGVRGVVFHTGRLYGFRESSYLKNWQRTNETIVKRLLDDFPKQEIYMENMFDEEPDVLATLGKSLDKEERFGICLDYAHASVFGFPQEQWVKKLAPYTMHMHINDNDGRNDLHLAVGAGSTDWQEYTREMNKYQMKASVLIEVTEIEAQKKSLEYMASNHIWPL